jgi:hypothetical protein
MLELRDPSPASPTTSALSAGLRTRDVATQPIRGVTSIYLQGIDSGEIIETVRGRRAPVIPPAQLWLASGSRPKRYF